MRNEAFEEEGATETIVKPNKAGSGRKAASKGARASDAKAASSVAADDKEKTDGDGPGTGAEGPGKGESNGGSKDSDSDSAPEVTLQEQLANERDKYLRLAAEYDNYRKRTAKERETMYQSSRADVVVRLLPVYDNLERALKMECSDEAFYKGVEMTMTGLVEILEGMDVKRIDAVREPFDPNRHNAVMSIENPEFEEKVVAEEFQKGFTLGDKVIRHSTVVVAN